MKRIQILTAILIAVTLSCGNGDSQSDVQSEGGTGIAIPSSLDTFLADNGFESVNSINENEETPLQLASYNGDSDMVQLLIEHGAELDMRGRNGSTPLSCAAIRGHLDVVEILMEEGAGVDFRVENAHYSETPLHQAAGKGHTEIVEILLNAGADIEAVGIAGMTPLHMASGEGQLEVMELLIANGSELEAVSTQPQCTPLQLALNTENYAAIAMLVENGANDEELFTIESSRVGLFEIGIQEIDIQEIALAYGDVTLEEVDLMHEGMYSPAVEITLNGDSSAGLILEIYPDDDYVYRIKILSDRFRTSDGLGISSTVGDVQDIFDFQGPYWSEGGGPFIVIEDMNASMGLVSGDWWVMGELQGELPPETEVETILIL